MFDLRRLALLTELSHRGTLAAVADALGLSPSAVSQQLALLAEEAGTPLLEPVGRNVRLTRQAEILVRHAEAAIAELEEAQSEVARSAGTVGGLVRIATFQTAAIALVPAAIEALRAKYEDLEIFVAQLEPERSIPALLARDFDLIIAEEYLGTTLSWPGAVHSEELWRDRLRIGIGPRSARQKPPPSIAALTGHPWVLEPPGYAARTWADLQFSSAGIDPIIRFESTDVLLHRRLVERGLAYGFLPDLVWDGGAPTVRILDLPESAAWRRILTAVRRGQESHPAVEAIRAALQAAAARASSRA